MLSSALQSGGTCPGSRWHRRGQLPSVQRIRGLEGLEPRGAKGRGWSTLGESTSWVQAPGPQAPGSVEAPAPGRLVPEDPRPSVLKLFSSFHQDMFDKTKSGRIDVYGFSALWKFIQQWKNLFQQYDRDHSGSISYAELQQGEGRGRGSAQAELDFSIYSLGREGGFLQPLTPKRPAALYSSARVSSPSFCDRAGALSRDPGQGSTRFWNQGQTPQRWASWWR